MASFNGKLRDELFAREIFDSVMEVRILFDDWADVYNRTRRHSSLGMLTSVDYEDLHRGSVSVA